MQYPDPNTGSNKSWSMNDPSLKNATEKGWGDPDAGLRSHDTEALGADRYSDPHQEQPLKHRRAG